MIHDGAETGAMRLPKRHGMLFDPDRFTFLEGRLSDVSRNDRSRIEPPLLPDGEVLSLSDPGHGLVVVRTDGFD